MIAHWTYRTVSFLAARVKNRLRFAAPAGHKARRALTHRAFRLRGQRTDGERWLLAGPCLMRSALVGPTPATRRHWPQGQRSPIQRLLQSPQRLTAELEVLISPMSLICMWTIHSPGKAFSI